MIGAIADDYSGATDAAAAIRRAGLRTLLYFGRPGVDEDVPPCDAVVVALKIRTAEPAYAVTESLGVARWLRSAGARQIYYKYCSTFDSTPRGNIGPVLDALSLELDAATVIHTPSSPQHGRTQYHGYLFVDGVPLAESPMRLHPLTPMTDSSLPRLLKAQTVEHVDVIPHPVVQAGARSIRNAVAAAVDQGSRYLFADAIDAHDMQVIGHAALRLPLVAGASGLVGALAAATAATSPSLLGTSSGAMHTHMVDRSRAIILSGSCSSRTLQQIEVLKDRGHPSYRLNLLTNRDATSLAEDALQWYDKQATHPTPLIYTSLTSTDLREVQASLGAAASSELAENAIARTAVGAVKRGVRRILAAGGETSGAIVAALDVRRGVVGPEMAAGVPWIYNATKDGVALLLKSGNFGDADLLARASEPHGLFIGRRPEGVN